MASHGERGELTEAGYFFTVYTTSGFCNAKPLFVFQALDQTKLRSGIDTPRSPKTQHRKRRTPKPLTLHYSSLHLNCLRITLGTLGSYLVRCLVNVIIIPAVCFGEAARASLFFDHVRTD